MATNTGVYDFSKCIVLINHPLYGSPIVVDGFMNDTSITVARTDPRWANNPSGDGKSATMVKNPITAGTITFTLNQSTDSLAKLNAITQHADASDGSDILFEITVADKSSGSFHFSRDAIVGDPESVEYGREENGREFVVQCGSLSNTLNGSAKVSKETLRIVQALGFNIDASRVANY